MSEVELDPRVRRVGWMFYFILLVGLFILGCAVHKALSATGDPVVTYFEQEYHIYVGGYLPLDTRYPNAPRLQYFGATPIGHGCYHVNVCRR